MPLLLSTFSLLRATNRKNKLLFMRSNTTLIQELFDRVEGAGTDGRYIEPQVVTLIPAKVKGLNPVTSCGPSHRATVVEISQRGLALRVDCSYVPGASVQIFVSKEIFVGKVLRCRPSEDAFVIEIELRGGILSASQHHSAA